MPNVNIPELLCPAGDEDALHAAVDMGADAVYLGFQAFGARASAVNFDEETLARAVHYAHLHHVRVHVTVNTLIKQTEIPAVTNALEAIADAGADAVIVQDLGVASIVRSRFPMLEMHASTQMALCNAQGARLAKQMGYSRVVMARECSLPDVRLAAQTGIDIEVFVHGALCSAVSGRCLMSSMSGGRSGNRGRCAQPCRQGFSLNGESSALLSLRDLCLIDDLPALCDAGVRSLKVEGRLKSAEYVAVVTKAYRHALDLIQSGAYAPGDKGVREQLLQIFNRGGFTRGHVMGEEDAALCAGKRVSHEGVMLGTVLSTKNGLASVRVERELHDGDSLQIRGNGVEADIRYAGHTVQKGDIATVRLRPGVFANAGDEVARLSDALQLEQARIHAPKPIPVHMHAALHADKPITLTLSDRATEVSVQGECAQHANNRPTTAQDVRKQLAKLGDTPFSLASEADVYIQDGLFVPVSALNALRREGVQQLADARAKAFWQSGQHTEAAFVQEGAKPNPLPIPPSTLAVVFSEPSLAQPLKDAGATWLLFEPKDFTENGLQSAIESLPAGTWLRLYPQLSQSTLDMVVRVIGAHKQTIGGVMVENIGQLALPVEVPILAGEGIPVTNQQGMQALLGTNAGGFVLWPEWTQAEQQALLPFTLPCLLKVYGRETLMLLNHCPERATRGLQSGRAQCTLCTKPSMACGQEDATLTDRKGYQFPISRTVLPEGCALTLLGALPTDLAAFENERRSLGAGMLLHMTTEPPQRQVEMTAAFARLMAGEQPPQEQPPQTTSGHWKRGVQ